MNPNIGPELGAQGSRRWSLKNEQSITPLEVQVDYDPSGYFAFFGDMRCLGCGAFVNPNNPQPASCDECPPRRCTDCDEMDHVSTPCSCWQHLEGMALTEMKSVFARSGLSLDSRPEKDTP